MLGNWCFTICQLDLKLASKLPVYQSIKIHRLLKLNCFIVCVWFSVPPNCEIIIKLRAACVPAMFCPSFITRGRIGARKAALMFKKIFNFDDTPEYSVWNLIILNSVDFSLSKRTTLFMFMTRSFLWRQWIKICLDLPYLTLLLKSRYLRSVLQFLINDLVFFIFTLWFC